jgi:hypothetical protein
MSPAMNESSNQRVFGDATKSARIFFVPGTFMVPAVAGFSFHEARKNKSGMDKCVND